MSGKLDQSLDEIMKDRKPTAAAGSRRGTGRPARKAAVKAKAATTAVVAPSGGIQKKGNKKRGPVNTARGAAASGETSKIAVSNLPLDVTQANVEEYFTKSVGPVRSVVMSYNEKGISRGTAIVVFHQSDAAAKAAKYDGTRVDNKAFRIEVLVGAKSVAASGSKSLLDRITKPKNANQDKPKAAGKGANKGEANGAAKNGRTRPEKKSGRAGKPKAKTTEELDAEMKDYFGGEQTNGAAATGGDIVDDAI